MTDTIRICDVWTLHLPTTGRTTPFPVDKRRPVQQGDRSRTDFEVRSDYAHGGGPKSTTEQCLTRGEMFGYLQVMHNNTRLTARRIKLLIAALAAEECSLIENELWRDEYPSEAAARKEIDATYDWLYAQLDKREKAAA